MQIYSGLAVFVKYFGQKKTMVTKYLIKGRNFALVKQETIIDGFVQLGKLMTDLSEGKEWGGYNTGVTKEEYEKLAVEINKQVIYNGWFTPENVRQSLSGIAGWLTKEKLEEWCSMYPYNEQGKKIAIIMAGNIPLVGFHDFLAVLVSGNYAVCKLSSDDQKLLPLLAEQLMRFVPALKDRIFFSTGRLPQFEAVIATGSNNSIKFFEEYFGKYPHIFRKNRTSIAVLDGSETEEEITELGKDIFSYFGLGCRNVSHLLIPEDFDIDRFFKGIFPYQEVVHHKKYGNNYDYNKAVYLLNKHDLLDNNFVLLKESTDLHSPLAMVHFHRYKDQSEAEQYIKDHESDIQVVVGKQHVPFGFAQEPTLTDYADGVDTMEWISKL